IVYRNGKALSEPYENEQPQYDLEIKDYTIYVNGTPLDRSVANIPARSKWSAPNRVPAGFFFMLGDNRNYSDDSHVWGFAQTRGRYASGPLASKDVTASFAGRAFMIFWPLNRLCVLH
ncbi:MAG TPA: S26 family signal peptidase, partial [Candidatus Baltobacteraceae bacterium]|nr:S26 family signal peptidase [Candidatus Baltobacteraceae bacterium]